MQKKPKQQKNHHKPGQNIAAPGTIWIYGKHPTLMAIAHQKRKIYQILINKHNKEILENEIRKYGIKIDPSLIRIVDNNYISSILPIESVHQGFALKALPIPTIKSSDFINKISANKNTLPKILILDQLTDPHNIGAIIRSAASFGVKDVIITKHNFPKESGIICKSSSGMIELVNIIEANNINNLLANLKDIGYWCIGLDGNSDTDINKVKDYKDIALIIGSEGNGIRPLVKKNCDLLVKIPINQEVESLNASNAAAICLYELFSKNYEI